MSTFMRTLGLGAVLTLLPGLALAHTGHGDAAGFAHGFMHPLGGLDHLLAMVTVGLFAAALGGRALWAVPASFVAMMLVGGALGMAGLAMPFVENAILLSVIALGAVVALNMAPPVLVSVAIVGFFALFHGHAHGAEMPAGASGLGYAAGFVLATSLLHAAGLVAGLGFSRFGDRLARLAGGAVTVAGLGLASGLI
ncbi:MAG: HupE/UreJ family protein [Labrys sp. (in: a-proteobacteria)]